MMKTKRLTLENGVSIRLEPAVIDGFIPGDLPPAGVKFETHCGWDNEQGISRFTREAPLFAAWHRAQARALGTGYSQVLAWENNRIVGFLSFCPVGEGNESFLRLSVDFERCCPYIEQSSGDARRIDAMPIEKLEVDTILLTCAMSVSPRLKRAGLATAMLRYLIDLARENGWRTIKATARLPETQDDFWPPIGLFERVGFRRSGPDLDLDGGRVKGCEVIYEVSGCPAGDTASLLPTDAHGMEG